MQTRARVAPSEDGGMLPERSEWIFAGMHLDQVPQVVRKIVIAVIGTTVLLIGVALIILPGPAFIVIPIGLAILATEFIWARRVVKRGRIFVKRAGRAVKSKVAT